MLHEPLSDSFTSRHHLTNTDRLLVRLAKLLDAAFIVAILFVVLRAYGVTTDPRYAEAALLAAMTFHLIAGTADIYGPWRGETLTRQFFRISLAWAGSFFTLLFLAYALKSSADFSRIVMSAWFILVPFTLSGWRVVARHLLSRLLQRPSMRRNVMIWGSGDVADQLARIIETNRGLGLTLVEFGPVGELRQNEAHQTHGTDFTESKRIELAAQRGDFSILYIVLGTDNRADVLDLIERLADTTVSIYVVPDYLTTSLFQGRWSSLQGLPIVSVFDTPFWGANGWVKKAQDVIVAGTIVVIMAIPMAIIAVAVKLTSPGPVFFRQRRYGIDGKQIMVLKFRTMTVCEDGEQVRQASKDDSRVTKLGAFLRRNSLDELPQFFNVLDGEMSIVGPRPHAVAHNEFYRSKVHGYMLRHTVKPGITGWAQVNGWRGETDDLYKMQKRVEYDLWYIRNWSLALDLKIIFLTVIYGFRGRNAY